MAVATALGGLVVAAAVPDARGYLSILAAFGVASFVAAVIGRWSAAIGAGVVCLGAAFVLGHLDRDGVPTMAIVVGPALLAASQMAHWSIEMATPVVDEPGVHLGRWSWFVGSVGGGVALCALLVGASRVQVSGDLPLDAVAVVAAVALVTLAAALARRRA